ncbi:(+)-kolavelool synthase [Herpetosiphon llansteffanensis]|uniref:(+)-kolavelool synthase n=1 Tax=Herpetosiphon llansteffanensis TaxID=2094568 RepID=UPI000D7CFA27|nr:hypothetical protein [Herpetosiphon llansteffanensis]
MTRESIPTLAEFLQAPLESIRQVAPTTMVFSSGGSRRKAALANLPATGEEYARWSHGQLLACLQLFFRHGIKHLFLPMLLPNQFQETTPNYREHIERWVAWGAASPAMRDYYREHNWRVRLLDSQASPIIAEAAQSLHQPDDNPEQPTLWWFIVRDSADPWQAIFQAAHQTAFKTRSQAIEALYGEIIPPAELFVSFGKPQINHDVLPPLLVGNLQCYWTQKPGYTLSEREFREILYDFAFLRQTWQADKTERTKAALEFRQHWERGPILGLGQQLGPFWYPQSTSIESEL